jgi:hypothetical protein
MNPYRVTKTPRESGMAEFKKVVKPYRAICFRVGRLEVFEYFGNHDAALDWAQASFNCDHVMVEFWSGQRWTLSVPPSVSLARSNYNITAASPE